ncbi:Outer membrane receptor proteins, mostly Fe transport [Pustulibacterium marinum]|uniref:Outer membrane receptor proteins, mostly Fe transport n=1 Tax=Pustulibacterium marinum TaxID=1224947 RepID=A0A1I7IUT3_9FLAO|nr:TonB-dependent receptor [Pustulibacterium marinum]SFU76680.1 Outer membrane receptor proteins, mostly Fe transport [Pustulibacterium marinum]
MLKQLVTFCSFLLIGFALQAQKANITGVILDENNLPIEGVVVTADNENTVSNENGFYNIQVTANKEITIIFSHLSFKKIPIKILPLEPKEVYKLHPVMSFDVQDIGQVIITENGNKQVEGVKTIDPKTIENIPGAQPGVENIIKTFAGVISNNELSSQYSVRGGNYDENLVYVNEIEVYRPFLIRSGQQEGLSFVNTDLVQNVEFSAGGFQAKYGDKMSSVLDITYKTPTDFGATVSGSLLGASASLATNSKNKKFSSISGIRYRNNSLLVNSKQTETNYDPIFADFQTYLTYQFSEKFTLNFLGNVSINQYNYSPLTRQTNFGTIDDPVALLIYYEGQEEDEYLTTFGAFKANYLVNENTVLKLIGSAYHTTEQEYFDILAQYRMGDVNTSIGSEDLGEVEYSEGIGSQLNHARNDLDALIFNLQHKGTFNKNDHQIEWGIKYTHEDIRDRLVEWESIDSAGFAIRPYFEPANDQPYNAYEGPLVSYQSVRATNYTNIDRVSAFGQWSYRTTTAKNTDLYFNAGVRMQNWTVSGENIETTNQTIISPRGQFAIKPNWEKDMLFRLSGGIYYQPPFYRELRDSTGMVNPNVKAQKSIHAVFGNDYSFQLWKRPFKLTTEAYYKKLTDVNTYTIENVRIRYQADNNAEAYAYGLDLQMNGEFVPGTESWVSFGYLKTEENIDNRGYIARPTDQRLKFGLLFQDYVPNIPSLKMYLNLTYNTGVPGGSPSYADPYVYQTRLDSYKRADAGFSYVLTDSEKKFPKGHWLHPFKEFTVGFEIYNIFENLNSITNTWVRDVYTKRQYGIPNYMTGRVFNVKFNMKF